jgi:hypothetical protein
MKSAILALVCVIGLGSFAHAGDIWVDDGGSNLSGDGSSSNPYKIITYVVLNVAVAGDVIKIKPGTYNEVLGEAFPITMPDDVDLYGSDLDQYGVPLALIGGDVNDDSPVSALIRIDATAADRDDIGIQRLLFLGESTASVDAPCAVEVLINNGYELARSGIADCVFERPEMNATGSSGRATIRIVADHTHATQASFQVNDSEIWASQRGAIELIQGNDTTDLEVSRPLLLVQDCTILIEGTDDADFGIFAWSEDGAWVEPSLKIMGTTIDSTGATASYGIATGIDIWLNATDGAKVQYVIGRTVIEDNEIMGCTGDAIRVRGTETDDESGSNANIVIADNDFIFNRIHGNGGAGVHVAWNNDSAYLSVHTSNNLIYDNAEGITLDGISSAFGGQDPSFLNDTIAHNAGYGLRIDGTLSYVPSVSLTNCILWGNNPGGNGDQHGGTAGWDPVDDGSVSYSCWENIAPVRDHNIDEDPAFEDSANGDFHLDSTSACIDVGTNFPTSGLPRTDLDGEDRTVNGDGQNGAEVDMGCDEFDP